MEQFGVVPPEINEARIPPGIRIYAIGDIHGRLDLLHALLGMILAREAESPSQHPALIFLGDYVDRGPDSRGVIDFLLNELPDEFQKIFLRGNHEAMLLGALENPDIFDVWATNGGIASAQSYGVNVAVAKSYSAEQTASILGQLEQLIPQSHYEFLRALQLWAKVGDYFFVHAGVRPGIPLREQFESDCLFIRDEFLRHEGRFEKIIVHGHTPVRTPDIRQNRIGIDTGAVFTGRLTALCLEGRTKKFLMTNS